MHTPGPWKCTNTSHHYYDYRLEGEHGQLPFEKLAAYDNARLIAAAPELLEALKELKADFSHVCESLELSESIWTSFAKTKDAIAKAEGR